MRIFSISNAVKFFLGGLYYIGLVAVLAAGGFLISMLGQSVVCLVAWTPLDLEVSVITSSRVGGLMGFLGGSVIFATTVKDFLRGLK